MLISHDLDYVARYADQVMLLDKTVLASGTPGKSLKARAFKKSSASGRYRRYEMNLLSFLEYDFMRNALLPSASSRRCSA